MRNGVISALLHALCDTIFKSVDILQNLQKFLHLCISYLN